jgi:hypothetical protein
MTSKSNRNLLSWVFLLFAGGFLLTSISSCGKGGAASPTGLNIQYEVLNLSPDLGPINLFVDFTQVNAVGNPFIFGVNQGYFYVPSTVTPYQFRSGLTTSNTPIPQLNANQVLQSGAKYSLFITGSFLSNSLDTIFTVDTSLAPKTGYGKLRFVDASPSATGGLDVYANGTLAFPGIVYRKHSDYIVLPAGNYDLQIDAKGTTTILNEQQTVTIQDGRLYTLYAYGYTNVVDSASFTSAVITNR